jgi:hypothetical protein
LRVRRPPLRLFVFTRFAQPRAYRELRHCGCLERPEPGSVWAERLAHEAARQVELYGNV